jgi:hypothetical protein
LDNIQGNAEPDYREKCAKMRNQNPAEKPLDEKFCASFVENGVNGEKSKTLEDRTR